MNSYFAVAAPGLEPFTAAELQRLDLQPVAEPGGVLFKGGLADLYRANLHLRTASRILARLGNFFYATTYPDLRLRFASLPWERFLVPGQSVSLHVTCRKSRLNHTDRISRCISNAINERLGHPSPIIKAADKDDVAAQQVLVRIAGDRVTVSLDSSGVILHKRGYRQAVAKAPLRETLAAGMIAASGWDCRSPLLDPFCGSGTIAIEAAMLALGIPPGSRRRFAFMDWQGYDAQLWHKVSTDWQPAMQPPPKIVASDRDAGAIRSAQANALRAGMEEVIEFSCQAVSSITPPAEPGWVITNPPYGQRIHSGGDLRDLYARFGDVLRSHCPGWHLSLLCSDRILSGQLHMKFLQQLPFENGGLPVLLSQGIVPAESSPSGR